MRLVGPARYEQLKTSGHLPSPKRVPLAIIRLLQHDDYRTEDLIRLLQSDPAISRQLLKFANSAICGQRRPAYSLAKAIALIGAYRLRTLVLGFSILQSHRIGRCAQFNYMRFWSRSLITAIATQALAPYAKFSAAESFIAGLLSNIGELALASIFPERYGEIYAASDNPNERRELERKAFKTDSRELGATMLINWGLPEALVAAVYHYETPDEASFADGSQSKALTHSLHIAHSLADVCLNKNVERRMMVPNLLIRATGLGISAEELSLQADAIVLDWREWGKMLGIQTQEFPSFADLFTSILPVEMENTSHTPALLRNQPALAIGE